MSVKSRVQSGFKVLTIAKVACDAFTTRRHDFMVANNLLILSRGAVVSETLAGKRFEGIVMNINSGDVRIGLWSAAVVNFRLGLDICLMAWTFDRRAASVHILRRRFRALGYFSATADSYTFATNIGCRLGDGSDVRPRSFSLDIWIGFGYRFAAVASFGFIWLNSRIADDSFFGLGGTATAFAGLNLGIGSDVGVGLSRGVDLNLLVGWHSIL
jgi:hypothetical protein